MKHTPVTEYAMGLISAPSELARELAHQLVALRLAACAQVTGPIESFYWWEGKLETTPERLIYLKTRIVYEEKIRLFLVEKHPYKVPEFILLPLVGGNPLYLNWIAATLEP